MNTTLKETIVADYTKALCTKNKSEFNAFLDKYNFKEKYMSFTVAQKGNFKFIIEALVNQLTTFKADEVCTHNGKVSLIRHIDEANSKATIIYDINSDDISNNPTYVVDFTELTKCTPFKKDDFIASQIGFYEKNGMSVTFFATHWYTERGGEPIFKVSFKDNPNDNRIDKATFLETKYISKNVNKFIERKEKVGKREERDLMAKEYYHLIV